MPDERPPRTLLRRLSQWADAQIPPEWDDDQRLRARFSMLLPAAMGAFAWAVGIVQLIIGVPVAGIIAILAGCAGFASMGLVHWTRSLNVSVSIQLALFQVAVSASSFMMGGGMSMPSVFSTLLIPILAAVMVSRLAAVVWGGIAAAWMVALFLLDRMQLTPKVDLQPERFTELNTVGGILTMAIFVAVALMVEAMRRQRIEKLERARRKAGEAMRAKSAFLANMSHEIRTPLHGLLGNIALLQETSLDSEQRQLLVTASGAGDSLLELVNEILDLSKIEAGRLTLQLGEIDVAASVQQVVTTTAPLAEDRGLELVVELEPTLPRVVKADGKRLRQVLANLVGNAIKFTEHGHVAVAVSSDVEDGRANIRFEVRDSGAGMTEAEQKRLFRPFEQGDSSTSRRHTGTGLGLSISRRLVQLMGSDLLVRSAPGEGSTFHFSVSLDVISSAAEAVDRRVEGQRVLVIGAHPVVADSIKRMLTTAGAEHVACVADKDEIDGLGARLFDVAIVDVEGVGGVALVDEIVAELDSPVIVLTPQSIRRYGHLPESAVTIHKPVLLAPLARAIHNATSVEGRTGRMLRSKLVDSEDGVTVLIVDDNPVNQRVTQAYLQHAGYECELADNGEEAVARFGEATERYGAVLMDCHMPVLDGYEAALQIRELEPAGHHVPIIALTADAMPGTRDKVLTSGMDEYLAKPFRKEQLVEILQRHCAPHSDPKHAAS